MTKFSRRIGFLRNALQFRMAGGNGCIVKTLPSICEHLTLSYFQETNQTVCVKYAHIFSRCVDTLYTGWFSGARKLSTILLTKFIQGIHSYVRTVGI